MPLQFSSLKHSVQLVLGIQKGCRSGLKSVPQCCSTIANFNWSEAFNALSLNENAIGNNRATSEVVA